MSKFGNCECGGKLEAVYFEMQESKVSSGRMIWTNRYKRACAELECDHCGKGHAIDDSLDGNWYTKVTG